MPDFLPNPYIAISPLPVVLLQLSGEWGVLRKCYKTHFSIDKDLFLWTRQRFVKTLIVKTGKTNYLINQLFQNVMHDQTNVRIEKIKTK